MTTDWDSTTALRRSTPETWFTFQTEASLGKPGGGPTMRELEMAGGRKLAIEAFAHPRQGLIAESLVRRTR